MFCSAVFLASLLVPPADAAARPASFQLADRARILLVGNALIEQEQRQGYWEAALLRRYPARHVTVRNLGWSGDTVWGEARAGFGTAADGFRSLKEQVASLKPTVILVGYGSNEAFAGPSGLARFQQGLDALLDMLAQSRSRIVLLSPLRQENLGPPLPDPATQNRNLGLYRGALKHTAGRRGLLFVDFYELLGPASAGVRLTDDEVHLTAYGYWRAATTLEEGLGLPAVRWRIDVSPNGAIEAEGTEVVKEESRPLRLRVNDHLLPLAPSPGAPADVKPPREHRLLAVQALPPGRYELQIDGLRITQATAAEWAKGIALTRGPEFEQAEKLRTAIIAKNREYFHRWRPQNETYLFGFRKYEQGQNAREVPQFEPLVAQLEEVIATLLKPVAHTYELRPLDKD